MALSTYLLRKSRNTPNPVVDGIYSCLYTVDPALTPSDSAAKRLVLAVAACNVAMGFDTNLANTTLPDDYFDEAEQLIGAAAGGYLPADDDVLVHTAFGDVEDIA